MPPGTFALLPLLLTLCAAQNKPKPATPEELAAISQRGRLLAEYDRAAWAASDGLQALKPDRSVLGAYIAQQTSAGWTVAFGRLSEEKDKFLIAYEASGAASSGPFQVRRFDPPKEDRAFFRSAARAIPLALGEFTAAENRPHNVAVLPAGADRLYVYVLPAQTKEGVYPLGGDARYLVSGDGLRIVEKRQLHKSIIEFRHDPGVKTEAGVHTAVLDEVPEDTDVFHVLVRRPSVPEWVATKSFVYVIAVDGSIKYLMTAEALARTQKGR